MSATRGGVQRLLVFVPARRHWAGRGAAGPGASFDWVAVGADGSMRTGQSALAQLPSARSVELVFDALDVFSATVDAPRLGEARLRQALPNLLEERMLADPADCHVAWAQGAGAGPGDGPQPLGVAAIHRATLARVLEACAQAGVEPEAAYSELHLVAPPADGAACVRIGAQHALLRLGDNEAASFDAQEGATVTLSLARAQSGLRSLTVYGTAPAALLAAAAELGLRVQTAASPLDADSAAQAVNLLQGAYATTARFGASGRWLARVMRSGAWHAPAAWLCVCAVLAVLGLNLQWLKLEGQYRDARSSMRQAFHDAFPTEGTIYDELAQARRLVAGLRARTGRPSPEDFTVLNAQALSLLSAAPPGIVAGMDYADAALVLHFKPGAMDAPDTRSALQGRALQMGLDLRFDPDGSAHLAPRGS